MYSRLFIANNINYSGAVAALVIIHIFFSTVAFGQVKRMEFNHLSVDEGLSHSTVFAITKDKNGFMWFGTRDGLNKYDARRISIYKHSPDDSTSISNNAILSLLSDSKGRLWIGSGVGLNLYNPVRDNFSRIKLFPKLSFSKAGNHIHTVFEDLKHNIWVGTREGLFLLPQGELNNIKIFLHDPKDPNSLPNSEVRKVFEDKEGVLWIGTSNGLAKLVYESNDRFKFEKFFMPNTNADQKSYNWINTIAEDDKGLLWIGTEKTGLKFFDKKKSMFSSGPKFMHDELNSGKIRLINKDKNNDFWIGSIGGLYIINSANSHVTKLFSNNQNSGDLSDHSIRSIYIDDNDIYWVGTFYGGVNYYSPLSKQFGKIHLGDLYQSKFKVTSKILTDDNLNVWISTEGSGLFYLDKVKNKIANYRHSSSDKNSLTHNNIKTIMRERGGLWIGTLFGLNFLDLKSGKYKHYFHNPEDKYSVPDDVSYSIKRDSKGRLWVGTYNGGLSILDEATQKFITLVHDPKDPASISSNAITYIFEDSKGLLWFGTTNGLNQKHPNQDKFKRYLTKQSEEQSFNGTYILCIHEDKKGRMWISTQNGLNLLDTRTGKVQYFTTAEGLPANTVYGILEDDRGYLWLSTQNGIARLHPDTFNIQTYNKEDGLVSKEFSFNSFHKDAKGYMYFGGYNGVVVFHPDSILVNAKTPELIFTKLRLYNKIVEINDGDGVLSSAIHEMNNLTFKYNQNIFSLDFAVLNFVNSNKNQFAYKLEGFDNAWNYVSEPVASYMNLIPGNYTLLIKGSNNDGVWSEPKSLPITILPPPWKTWWAYSLYVSIFIGLLLIWSRIHKSRLKLTHNLELEHLENLRQEELHQTKIKFFSNIAHELRTPLTLIVSPVQMLTQKYRQDVFLHNQLKVVSANTDRLLRLLNQLLDFNKHESGIIKLKLEKINIVEWLRDIEVRFQEHARMNKIDLVFQSDYQEIFVTFDPEELEKVFYNLLSNAFKFTPGGGQIFVRIALDTSPGDLPIANTTESIDFREVFVKIMVEDNGLGIAAAHLPKIFDRFYQADNQVASSGGFGIGLALAKEIIKSHNGLISVESQEGLDGRSAYTRFLIQLPLLAKNILDVKSFQEETLNGRIVSSLANSPSALHVDDETSIELLEEEIVAKEDLGDRVSVLIVEDNVDIRAYLKGLFEPFYSVYEAPDGQEGWEIAIEHLPNIIISDVSMPRMDGFELTKKLKLDERTNHIPIILLTARVTIIHQVEGLELGADEYMSKPFNIQLLLLKVKNILAVREKLKEKYGRIVSLQPLYQEVEDPEDKFLQRLMLILEMNLSNPEFNVSELVSKIGMSRPVLFRKTKMLTGLSVIDLIRSVRLKKAEMLLKQNRMKIAEIAYEVGFSDPKYFSRLFRNQFGKTPKEYADDSKMG